MMTTPTSYNSLRGFQAGSHSAAVKTQQIVVLKAGGRACRHQPAARVHMLPLWRPQSHHHGNAAAATVNGFPPFNNKDDSRLSVGQASGTASSKSSIPCTDSSEMATPCVDYDDYQLWLDPEEVQQRAAHAGHGSMRRHMERFLHISQQLLDRGQLSPRYRKQVEEQHSKLSKALSSDHVLGVLGDTGCGKSTLMNAILGERLLPTGASSTACTSVPIRLQYSKGEKQYKVTVGFKKRSEWLQQVYVLITSIMAGIKNKQLDMSSPITSDISSGLISSTPIPIDHPDLRPIVALFGRQHKQLLKDNVKWECGDADVITHQINDLLPLVTISLGRDQGSKMTLSEALDRGVVERTGLELHSASALLGGCSPKPHSTRPDLEPILEYITVQHDWPVLSRGLVLLDLPGVRDADSERGTRAVKALPSCDSVLAVAQASRFSSNQTTSDFLMSLLPPDSRNMGAEDEMKTNIYHACIMVATHADVVPLDLNQLTDFEDSDPALFEQADVDYDLYLSLCNQCYDDPEGLDEESVRTFRAMFTKLRTQSVVMNARDQLGQVQTVVVRQAHAVGSEAYLRHLEHHTSLGLLHTSVAVDVMTDVQSTGLPAVCEAIYTLPDSYHKAIKDSVGQSLLSLVQMLQQDLSLGHHPSTPSGTTTTTATATAVHDIQARLDQELQASHDDLVRSLDIIEEEIAQVVMDSAAKARNAAHEDLGDALARLHWKTLQALCRSGGRTNGKSTVLAANYDLNAVIGGAIITQLTHTWPGLFAVDGRLTVDVVQPWSSSVLSHMDTALTDVCQIRNIPAEQQARSLAHSSVASTMEVISAAAASQSRGIAQQVKEAVQQHMGPVYILNAGLSGKGVARMMVQNLVDSLHEGDLFAHLSNDIADRIDAIHDLVTDTTLNSGQQLSGQFTMLVTHQHPVHSSSSTSHKMSGSDSTQEPVDGHDGEFQEWLTQQEEYLSLVVPLQRRDERGVLRF